MREFWKAHKKLHCWLAADLLALATFFACRRQRAWMNALEDQVTGPLRQALGRLFYRVEFTVMELTLVLAVLAVLGYVVWNVWAVSRARGHRGSRLYSAVLGAVCIGLNVYAVFCLLWGVNFWTDSFQDRSGIRAEPVAQEDLLRVTERFALELAAASEAVQRDEDGLFAVPRQEILDYAPQAYDALEQEMPFLEFDDLGVKPMTFSRLFSRMKFTGFYCSYTGESTVNVDSPANLLAATVCHELGHQRGYASEQECNFLGILAATTANHPAYRYAGWLSGYIHMSNALYRVDQESYWAIRKALPEEVQQDLAYNNAYWKQFEDTVIEKVSTTAYDGMLKAYGEERGIQSYGTVVDLLVAYYR